MDLILLARVLAALAFVAFNGLFVAAEFAFVRIRESSVEKLYDDGVKGSKSLSIVVKNLDDYLAVTQLGITVSSLALGWIGEPAFAHVVEILIGNFVSSSSTHIIGFAVGFSTITFLHVIFGELVPKTLSIQLTEKISLLVAPPMRFFRFIFVPGIIIFNGTANWITSSIGVPPASETSEKHSEQEIRHIIRSSTRQGLVDSTEEEMIRRVFEFDDTQLKQVMIPSKDVISIDSDAKISDAKSQIELHNHTRMPVVDNEEVVGILDVRNIIKADSDVDVIDVSDDALILPEVTSLDQALLKIKNNESEMAVIVDEWGSFEGIVTVEDIVEAIVGDIRDRFDNKKDNIERVDDISYIVSGGASIRKVREKTGIDIQSDDMDTISGWVMERYGSVPEEGKIITGDGFNIDVLTTEENMVVKAKIDISEDSNRKEENVED